MIAVAFSCGLGLGVVLGALLWSGAMWLTRQVLIVEQRRQVATIRQDLVAQKNRVEKAKADLRMQFGQELSPEQERVMEQELGTVFQERPHPQIPKR